jgi:hypothetical protein
MSGGYQAKPDEITQAGAQAESKGQQAQTVQAKIAAADGMVPEKAWGLLGNLTVRHTYSDVLSQLTDHMSHMKQGIAKLADDIKATADQYRQNEADVAQKFAEIQNDLDAKAG